MTSPIARTATPAPLFTPPPINTVEDTGLSSLWLQDLTIKTLYSQGYVSGFKIDFMFNRISAPLIPSQIRNLGGFYDVAQTLSKDDSSTVTFTIIPQGPVSIMQLKVSEKYPNEAKSLTQVDPLRYLKVSQLKKSDYYKVGFFPLNSIVHVVILPSDESAEATASSVIGGVIRNNQTVPSDLETGGWFFESDSGKKIEAMYLFGKEFTADATDLKTANIWSGSISSSFRKYWTTRNCNTGRNWCSCNRRCCVLFTRNEI